MARMRPFPPTGLAGGWNSAAFSNNVRVRARVGKGGAGGGARAALMESIPGVEKGPEAVKNGDGLEGLENARRCGC